MPGIMSTLKQNVDNWTFML